MRSQRKNKNNPLAGCVVIVLLIIAVIYVPDFIRRGQTYNPPQAVNPSVTFAWTRVPYDYASANTEIDIDLRACPELRCDVMANVRANQFIRIENFVIGGDVDGSRDWFEINHNGTLLYVPAMYVFSETATRMAMTEAPSGRFELTPTLLPIVADTPLCDEPKNDCNVLADLVAGDVVVTFAFVDGDGGVWVQVNYNNVIGYVVLDALDSVGGGE